MRDVLASLIFIPAGFPLGAGLALFILWMDKQKRSPRQRPAAAIPAGIAWIVTRCAHAGLSEKPSYGGDI